MYPGSFQYGARRQRNDDGQREHVTGNQSREHSCFLSLFSGAIAAAGLTGSRWPMLQLMQHHDNVAGTGTDHVGKALTSHHRGADEVDLKQSLNFVR